MKGQYANETLQQFQNRVYGFSEHSLYLNEVGKFETNPKLCTKVDPQGKLLPYIGNTTVFLLDEQNTLVREKLKEIQDKLYDSCGEMLAERLNPEHFHMTLHDLVNGIPSENMEHRIHFTGEMVKKCLKDIKANVSGKITMKSTWLFNMVNTSIVLGLEPYSQEDCHCLMSLYERIEHLNSEFALAYPMTPHITMAYYKPSTYDKEQIKKLQTMFEMLSQEKLMIPFDLKNLSYQEFRDMNDYLL